jgi:hypothetical protein
MQRSMKARIEKLEQVRKPTRRYVFYTDERDAAEAQGLPYILVPRPCATAEEWMAIYGPRDPTS